MIRQLDPSLRSHLRSGVAIACYAQCVEELVLNAVDAESTCIAVRVDLDIHKIQVVDNGYGMDREQLVVVGDRYATSKCHTLEDLDNLNHFGYRGEALSSIRDVSLILEIESRAKSSVDTYTKFFNDGKVIKVKKSKSHRPSQGTTVTAHGMFYNLPVRQKGMNRVLELEQMRQRLESIALMHPKISFSLRDDTVGNIILQTHKSNSVLGAFTHLFGVQKARWMKEVELGQGQAKVQGYISKEGHSNKNYQFIFINNRLVLKTKIHKLMNYLLGRSLIGKKMYNLREQKSPKEKGEMQISASPSRQSMRYGVFVLNVTCPLNSYDITFDPRKTLVEFKNWNQILKCIEEVVTKFLAAENLTLKLETQKTEESEIRMNESIGQTLEEPDVQSGLNLDSTSQDIQNSFDTVPGSSTASEVVDVQKYGVDISSMNSTNNLVSKTVKRPNRKALDQNELLKPVQMDQGDGKVDQNDEMSHRDENMSHNSDEVVSHIDKKLSFGNAFEELSPDENQSQFGDEELPKILRPRSRHQKLTASENHNAIETSASQTHDSKYKSGSGNVNCVCNTSTVIDFESQIQPGQVCKSSEETPGSTGRLESTYDTVTNTVLDLKLNFTPNLQFSEKSQDGVRDESEELFSELPNDTSSQNETKKTEEWHNRTTTIGTAVSNTDMSDKNICIEDSNSSEDITCGQRFKSSYLESDKLTLSQENNLKDGNCALEKEDLLTTGFKTLPQNKHLCECQKDRDEKEKIYLCKCKKIFKDNCFSYEEKQDLEKREAVISTQNKGQESSSLKHYRDKHRAANCGSKVNASKSHRKKEMKDKVIIMDSDDTNEKHEAEKKKKNDAHQRYDVNEPPQNNTNNTTQSQPNCDKSTGSTLNINVPKQTKEDAIYLSPSDNSKSDCDDDFLIHTSTLGKIRAPAQTPNKTNGHTFPKFKRISLKERFARNSRKMEKVNVTVEKGIQRLELSGMTPIYELRRKISKASAQPEQKSHYSSEKSAFFHDGKNRKQGCVQYTSSLHRLKMMRKRSAEDRVPCEVPNKLKYITPQNQIIKKVPIPGAPVFDVNKLSDKIEPPSVIFNRRGGENIENVKRLPKNTLLQGAGLVDNAGGKEMTQSNAKITKSNGRPHKPNAQNVNVSKSNTDNWRPCPTADKGSSSTNTDNGRLCASNAQGMRVLELSAHHAKPCKPNAQRVRPCQPNVPDMEPFTPNEHQLRPCNLNTNDVRHFQLNVQNLSHHNPKVNERCCRADHERQNEFITNATSHRTYTNESHKYHLNVPEKHSKCAKFCSWDLQNYKQFTMNTNCNEICKQKTHAGDMRHFKECGTCQNESGHLKHGAQKYCNTGTNIPAVPRFQTENSNNDTCIKQSEMYAFEVPVSPNSTSSDEISANVNARGRYTPCRPPSFQYSGCEQCSQCQNYTANRESDGMETQTSLPFESYLHDELENSGVQIKQDVLPFELYKGAKFPDLHDTTYTGNQSFNSEVCEVNGPSRHKFSTIASNTSLMNIRNNTDNTDSPMYGSTQPFQMKFPEDNMVENDYRGAKVKSSTDVLSQGFQMNDAVLNNIDDTSASDGPMVSPIPMIPDTLFQERLKDMVSSDSSERQQESRNCTKENSSYDLNETKIHLSPTEKNSDGNASALCNSPDKNMEITSHHYLLERNNVSDRRDSDTAQGIKKHVCSFDFGDNDYETESGPKCKVAKVTQLELDELENQLSVPFIDNMHIQKDSQMSQNEPDMFSNTAEEFSQNSSNDRTESESKTIVDMAIPGLSDNGLCEMARDGNGTSEIRKEKEPECQAICLNGQIKLNEEEQGSQYNDSSLCCSSLSNTHDSRSENFSSSGEVDRSQGHFSSCSSANITSSDISEMDNVETDDVRNSENVQVSRADRSDTCKQAECTDKQTGSNDKQAESNDKQADCDDKQSESNDKEADSDDRQAEINEMEMESQINVLPTQECVVQKIDTLEHTVEGFQTLNIHWVSKIDARTGQTLYVNLLTGNTTYNKPIFSSQSETKQHPSRTKEITQTSSKDTSSSKKHRFLSHNATPFLPRTKEERARNKTSSDSHDSLLSMLEQHQDLLVSEADIKWRDKNDMHSNDETHTLNSVACDTLRLLEEWENPVFKRPQQTVMNLELSQLIFSHRRNQALYPHKFSKEMFDELEVLGQVDKKFLACLVKSEHVASNAPSLLVMIDQHAAHERVRLEQLTEDIYESDKDGKKIQSSEVNPPVAMEMTKEEVRVLIAYRKQLEKIGIHFKTDSSSSNTVLVSKIPSCLVEREASERKRKRPSVALNLLETLLKDQVQMLQTTAGSCGSLPQVIHEVLCSQACHGAIKFGDPLTVPECQDLIQQLSQCKLPFQCAHGRPSIVPLLDVELLSRKLTQFERLEKPKLSQLRQRKNAEKTIDMADQ